MSWVVQCTYLSTACLISLVAKKRPGRFLPVFYRDRFLPVFPFSRTVFYPFSGNRFLPVFWDRFLSVFWGRCQPFSVRFLSVFWGRCPFSTRFLGTVFYPFSVRFLSVLWGPFFTRFVGTVFYPFSRFLRRKAFGEKTNRKRSGRFLPLS